MERDGCFDYGGEGGEEGGMVGFLDYGGCSYKWG